MQAFENLDATDVRQEDVDEDDVEVTLLGLPNSLLAV